MIKNMVLPEWCGCGFWFKACYRKFCCCLPPDYEYYISQCAVYISNFIYCFHKLLLCIFDVPIRMLKVLKALLCCASLTLSLLAIFLAVGISIAVRTLCDEITDFLDFIFVSGGNVFNPPFVIQSIIEVVNMGIYQWNLMVPYISPMIQLGIDLEISFYENVVAQMGTTEVEIVVQDALESLSIFTNIFVNIMDTVVQSNPQDLQNLADVSGDLTKEVIDNSEIIIPTIKWMTGPMMDITIPFIQSLITLTTTSTMFVSGTSRTLLDFTETATASNIRGNSFMGENANIPLRPSNDMAAKYIQDLKNLYENLRREKDLEGILKESETIRGISEEIRKRQMGRSADNVIKEDSEMVEVNEEDIIERTKRIRILSNLFKQHAIDGLSNYVTPSTITSTGTSLLNWMGFESWKHMNEHIKSNYGNGKGFVSSFAPHKHPIMEKLGFRKFDNSKVHFSEYMEKWNLTALDVANGDFDKLYGYRPGQRQLLFLPPAPLPPPLDCFNTVPVDPLCLIEGLLPLPLDPPDWFEPFVEFDCECDDYDASAPFFSGNAMMNALLVLQTIISAFFSIPFLSTFIMSITLPAFIEDNLFVDTPGDVPDADTIICALLHLDYFFIVALPAIILAMMFLYSLGAIWTCFKTYIELRVMREHQKLVDKILGAEDLGVLYDRIFECEAPNTMLNPNIYCYGNPDLNVHPTTFWRDEDYRPIYYNAINNLRVRTSCFGPQYPFNELGRSDVDYSRLIVKPKKPNKPPKQNNNNNSKSSGAGLEGELNLNIGQDMQDMYELEQDKYHGYMYNMATTHLQKQITYNAVKEVLPKASKEEIIRYHNMLYPEDHEYDDFGDHEIVQSAIDEFGDCDDIEITDEDRTLCNDILRNPYIHHHNTISFQEHVDKNVSNNKNIIVHQHIHVN